MRYTDEGETSELCKWTVDLSSLPTFQQNASYTHAGGFYTGQEIYLWIELELILILDFEVGLELDSVEARGILLYNNQEWGRYCSHLNVLMI